MLQEKNNWVSRKSLEDFKGLYFLKLPFLKVAEHKKVTQLTVLPVHRM